MGERIDVYKRQVTNGEGDLNLVKEILRSGQELLQRPITLLDGVQAVSYTHLNRQGFKHIIIRGIISHCQDKIISGGKQKPVYF